MGTERKWSRWRMKNLGNFPSTSELDINLGLVILFEAWSPAYKFENIKGIYSQIESNTCIPNGIICNLVFSTLLLCSLSMNHWRWLEMSLLCAQHSAKNRVYISISSFQSSVLSKLLYKTKTKTHLHDLF